jgi:hypothetical protein
MKSSAKTPQRYFSNKELNMRLFNGILILALQVLGMATAFASTADAQPPGRPDGGGRGEGGRGGDATSYVTRMMSFDTNKDGQLSKDEVTDTRLLALFERVDVNKDGIVTKDELTADFHKESANLGPGGPGGGRRGGPEGSGPGGPGGPGGRGFGGPGGPGRPPRIGQVMPPPVQEMLNLNDAQKKKIEDLQKHVDQQLSEILTKEQKQELEQLASRGPGGQGGPGRPGGDREGFGPPPGGPGGNRGREGGPGGPPGAEGRPRRPAND